MRDLLVCPGCRGNLTWATPDGARCAACGTDYVAPGGVLALVAPGTADPWARAREAVCSYLGAEPARRRALLDAPAESLNAADLMMRSLLHDAEGRAAEAASDAVAAEATAYHPSYVAARDEALARLFELVDPAERFVDVASGRGTIVRGALARGQHVVATDLSPSVLRGVRERTAPARRHLLECVAFDLAALPFPDATLDTVTTHLGLANLEDPQAALAELRRVVRGRFVAVMCVVGADGARATPAVRRDTCLALFERAGFTATVAQESRATAVPTPVGLLVEGAVLDAFPAEPTDVVWTVVVAS